MTDRPTILILNAYLTPDHRATGPYQSLIHVARALGERFRFRAVSLAAAGEPAGRWGELEGIERLPLARRGGGWRRFWHVLGDTPHDLVWANSFFDPVMTIPALLHHRLSRQARPLLVSPRGEFSPGALGLKAAKKRAWIAAARRLGLFSGVHIHATNPIEAAEARELLGPRQSILEAREVRFPAPLPVHPPRGDGEPLKVAFLSRIDRMKNLLFAIERLAASAIPATFDIIGPVTHEDYWRECLAKIQAARPPLAIRVVGAVDPARVVETLAGYDLFLLPTLGENFGHVILEALMAGTPALISDRTPWSGLEEARAGLALPLDRPEQWTAALRRFAAMPRPEIERWRGGARRYVEAALQTAAAAEETAAMFTLAMGRDG